MNSKTNIRIISVLTAGLVLTAGCADTTVKRIDQEIDQLVAKSITRDPGKWDWSSIKTQATGDFKELVNSSEWDTFIEYTKELGQITNAVARDGRTAHVHDHETGWQWEVERTIIMAYTSGNLTVDITWTKTAEGWKYSDLEFKDFTPSASTKKTKSGEIADEDLEGEVDKLLKGSNVTLRREIKKVHQLIRRYREQGQNDEAIALLRRMLTVEAHNLESQVMLAEILKEEGQDAESAEVASRAYALVESPELIQRLEKLAPELISASETNTSWNITGASENGPRIVLLMFGEKSTLAHREFGKQLNQLLGIPVTLKELNLPLESPERKRGEKWLNQWFQKIVSRMTLEQKTLLGLDFELSPDALLTSSQKVEAIEAFLRTKGDEGEKSIEHLHSEMERLRMYNQYDGQRLISEVKKSWVAAPEELVLIISAGDLFSGEANYIFSTSSSPYACMSFIRYTGAFGDKPESRPRMIQRMLKTGAWGAFSAANQPACTTAYCMRTYVHSLDEEDKNSNELCSTCRALWQKFTGITPEN